jgi:hypothetical protein
MQVQQNVRLVNKQRERAKREVRSCLSDRDIQLTPRLWFARVCWKEIASYLGRGVRTVQRYEREYQLPVRRVQDRAHASVLALAKGLDDWLRHKPLQSLESSAIDNLRSSSHPLEKHQKAISTLERNLLVLSEKLAEGQRIKMRQRWFGVED